MSTAHHLRTTVRRQAGRLASALEAHVRQAQARDLAESRARHGHHFLIRASGTDRPPPSVRLWPTRSVGGFDYHLHPATRMAVVGRVAVIGRPVDVDRAVTDIETIATRVATVWDGLAGVEPDDAAQQAVAALRGLAGRWVIVLHHDTADTHHGPLTVLTDPQASLPVVSGRETTVALASHARLLQAEDVVEVPADSWLRLDPQTGSAPLRVTLGRHTDARQPLEDTGPEAHYDAFRSRLVEHVRLLTTLGRPVIGLTGGLLSQATLAAYLPHRRPDELAYTVYDPESARTSTGPAADLFAASEVAQRLGLPHRVLRPTDDLDALVPPGAVDLRSVARPSLADAGQLFPDQAHEVVLPYNDRVLRQLWLAQPVGQRQDRTWLQRLAAEVSPPGAPR